MTTLTSIFNAYGSESLARYPTLPPAPLTTRQAIGACRTGAYGSSLSTCQSCGQHHRLSPACGHRHCPLCQPQKARQWLHKQLHTPLPGPYCLLTFPIPATLRPFCRSHPRLAFQAMFKASSDALKRLARAARFIGEAHRRACRTDRPTGLAHPLERAQSGQPSRCHVLAVPRPFCLQSGPLPPPSGLAPGP